MRKYLYYDYQAFIDNSPEPDFFGFGVTLKEVMDRVSDLTGKFGARVSFVIDVEEY